MLTPSFEISSALAAGNGERHAAFAFFTFAMLDADAPRR